MIKLKHFPITGHDVRFALELLLVREESCLQLSAGRQYKGLNEDGTAAFPAMPQCQFSLFKLRHNANAQKMHKSSVLTNTSACVTPTSVKTEHYNTPGISFRPNGELIKLNTGSLGTEQL